LWPELLKALCIAAAILDGSWLAWLGLGAGEYFATPPPASVNDPCLPFRPPTLLALPDRGGADGVDGAVR
jgi:hypothetical protein